MQRTFWKLGSGHYLMAALGAIVTLSLALGGAGSVARAQEKTESLSFSTRATQGPNAGLTLAGTMALTIDSAGGMTGVLTADDGRQIAMMSGQATGLAVNLVLTLADGSHIYGTGTTITPMQTDAATFGGGQYVSDDDETLGIWLIGTPSKPGGGG